MPMAHFFLDCSRIRWQTVGKTALVVVAAGRERQVDRRGHFARLRVVHYHKTTTAQTVGRRKLELGEWQ